MPASLPNLHRRARVPDASATVVSEPFSESSGPALTPVLSGHFTAAQRFSGRSNEQEMLIHNLSGSLLEGDTYIKEIVARIMVTKLSSTLNHDEFMKTAHIMCSLAKTILVEAPRSRYGDYESSSKYDADRFLEAVAASHKTPQEMAEAVQFFQGIFKNHNAKINRQLRETFAYQPDRAFIERASLAFKYVPQLAVYGLASYILPFKSGKMPPIEDCEAALKAFGSRYKPPEGFKNSHIEALTLKSYLSGQLSAEEMLPFSQAVLEYQQRTLTGEFDLYGSLVTFLDSGKPDSLQRLHLILEGLRLYQQSRPMAQVQFHTFRESIQKKLPIQPVEAWPEILAQLMQPEQPQKEIQQETKPLPAKAIAKPAEPKAVLPKNAEEPKNTVLEPSPADKIPDSRLNQIQSLLKSEETLLSGWDTLQALNREEAARWQSRWIRPIRGLFTQGVAESVLLSVLGGAPITVRKAKLAELQQFGWLMPNPKNAAYWQLTPSGQKMLSAPDAVQAMAINPQDLIALVRRDLGKLETLKQQHLQVWKTYETAYENHQARLEAQEKLLELLAQEAEALEQKKAAGLTNREAARHAIERSEVVIKIKLAQAAQKSIQEQSPQQEKIYQAQQLFIERLLSRVHDTQLKLRQAELALEQQQTDLDLASVLQQLQELEELRSGKIDFKKMENDAAKITHLLPPTTPDETELLVQQALSQMANEERQKAKTVPQTQTQSN